MGKELYTENRKTAASQVVLKAPFGSVHDIHTVTGLHIRRGKKIVYSTAVTVELPGFSIIEKCVERAPLNPDRSDEREKQELDLLLKTIRSLTRQTDVFICHADGINHPSGAGIASELGVALKRPVIGCTQALAYGQCQEPPPGLKGAFQYIRCGDSDILGISLRTRPFSAPVFVSPGHLMDVETAGDIVLACCTRYRLPEPLRFAISKK